MGAVKPRRAYTSERRSEQARSTRTAIMEAAGRLFIEQGYSRATMEGIAKAARVATITVYSAFGNKRTLLAELIGAAVSGDQASAPVYQQERALAVAREPDQKRQLALFVDQMWEIMERVSPLFEVVDHAAASEPAIAELRQRLLRGRLEGMRFFVQGLAAHGPLRPGVSEEAAAESCWAITAPQLFRLLTRDLGWDRDTWLAWAAEMLAGGLLG